MNARERKSLVMLLHVALVVVACLLVCPVEAIRRLPQENRSSEHRRLEEGFLASVMGGIRSSSSSYNNSNSNNNKYAPVGESMRRRENAVNVKIATSPDEHLVDTLPLLNPDAFSTKHWAGHLPASKQPDKYFFYWLFEPDLKESGNKDEEVPLVIWLNGGPGCSSMDGLWLENGPFRLTIDEDGNYEVTAAEYSWHKTPAYMLYIDQPVGTGFSFTLHKKYAASDHQINEDFYYFLQSFFKLHEDKFVKDMDGIKTLFRPFFFSGESYAGHYIPTIVNHILDKNANVRSGDEDVDMPVSGVAIGNGWVDPYHQYAGALHAYGHGLIDMAQMHALEAKEQECQQKLSEGVYVNNICFALIDEIVEQSQGKKSAFKVNSYDLRGLEPMHGNRIFPPGHHVLETYLGGWQLNKDPGKLNTKVATDVVAAIHATAATESGLTFKECTDPPYEVLADKDGMGVVPDVVRMLEHESKVQVLFFNGMEDLVCNHVGNERLLENLPWNQKDHWIEAKRYIWVAPYEPQGKVSGYMKEYDNLKFLKVPDAGHMVPLDAPNVGFQMIKALIYKQDFRTSEQVLERMQEEEEEECEDCPSCPAVALDDDDGEKADASFATSPAIPKGSFLISYTWAAGIVAIVAVFTMAALFGKRRQAGGRTLVPQYEMELQESSYRDAPSDDVKNNGSIL